MDSLKPCPFCGSVWLYETRRNGYCDETPTMFCNSCKAVVTWEQVEEEGVNDETKAFVREHWNTRAERTCRLVQHGSLANYPQTVCWSCSECNFGWHRSIYDKQFSYCPNCGAKVVE